MGERQPRIVTLTLNPAVDLACTAPSVRPTHKIRTSNERYDPGGGGINVARVVHALGGDARALIMTGGVTGRLIEELLDAEGIRWRSVPIGGRTRISVNVHDSESGLEYRFVPEGPTIAEREWRQMLGLLADIDADWIVASGSVPAGIPVDIYAQVASIARQRGQLFALDASGPALRAAIGSGIDLLKLSLGELEFLLGHETRDQALQDKEVTALLHSGAACRIAVSLGSQGALLATPSGIVRLGAIKVVAQNAVGAGDSFLAGLVLRLGTGASEHDALAFAVAVATAAVTTYGTALVNSAQVERLYRQLRPA